MAKIFKDGITVDDQTGKVYSVGNPDNLPAYTPPSSNTPGETPYYDANKNPIDRYAVANGTYNGTAYDSSGNPVGSSPAVTYNPDGTRSLSAADQYWKDNPIPTSAETAQQDNQTKADFATRQQQAIDSINNMYVSILAKANQQGQDKLGSTNVINALSGNRGSASGAANVDNTNQANDQIYQGILAEKQNKINTIMSNTYKDQTAELQYQNDLRRQNLDKYLAYMGTKENDNLTKSKAMRAQLIADNINVNDIAPDTLKQMADNAGYTVDQFKTLYEAEQKANQQTFLNNEQKRLTDLEKTKAETAKLQAEADPFDKSMMSKGYVPLSSPNDLKGLTENDIIRVGDKIYRKPITKPTTPVTKTVGKDLYQYNDKTGGWDKVVSASSGGGSSSSTEKAAVDEMNKAMSAVAGGDGYISPLDYTTLRKQWVDSGLSPTTFDTKFKGYRNPNNPNYVTDKQSGRSL